MDWKKEIEDGEVAFSRGRYKNALGILERARPECESAGDPKALFKCLWLLGRTYARLAKFEDSIKVLKSAVEIASGEFGKESQEWAAANTVLGFDLAATEKFAEAEELLNQALALRLKLIGAESKEVAETTFHLGTLKLREDKLNEAHPLFSKSLGIRERVLGKDSAAYAESLIALGDIYVSQRKLDAAAVMLKQAVSVLEKFGLDNANFGIALHSRAAQLLAYGNYGAAAKEWERAIPILEQSLSDDHPCLIAALTGLAASHVRAFEPRDAKPLFERALGLAERNPTRNQADIFACSMGVGVCLASEHNYKAAEPYFEKAQKQLTEAERDRSEQRLLHSMTTCYLFQGKFGKALYLMPDQMRLGHESNLKRYVAILNLITDLGERHAWHNEDE